MTYVGKDFSVREPDEVSVLSFDFGPLMAAGEAVATVAWTCEVVEGADPDAATRLQGAGSVTGSVASHKVGGLVAGTRYRIRAVATTSLVNVAALWSNVLCREVG